MPRKTFVAGEVLAAADVNTYLMDQAVMTFAGSAARGSAIASPSEGMVSYLEDTNSVEVFDSTNWIGVGGSQPGFIIDVQAVSKTDTFSSSVASSSNVAVTDLSITHALSNASNKLLITAYFGICASSAQKAEVGIGVANDGTLVNIADTAGNRTRVSAGGRTSDTASVDVIASPSIQFLYSPGDTSSHTYTVRAINISGSTRTLYVNRTEFDDDFAYIPRGTSGLVIQEVVG